MTIAAPIMSADSVPMWTSRPPGSSNMTPSSRSPSPITNATAIGIARRPGEALTDDDVGARREPEHADERERADRQRVAENPEVHRERQRERREQEKLACRTRVSASTRRTSSKRSTASVVFGACGRPPSFCPVVIVTLVAKMPLSGPANGVALRRRRESGGQSKWHAARHRVQQASNEPAPSVTDVGGAHLVRLRGTSSEPFWRPSSPRRPSRSGVVAAHACGRRPRARARVPRLRAPSGSGLRRHVGLEFQLRTNDPVIHFTPGRPFGVRAGMKVFF
jgi:hypothetical protein